MRDYYLFLVFGALLCVVLGWAFTIFASKNTQGAWDSASRAKGQYRSRKWKYKQGIESVRDYLVPQDGVWPFSCDAPGLHAVQSPDDTSAVVWKAVICPQFNVSTWMKDWDTNGYINASYARTGHDARTCGEESGVGKQADMREVILFAFVPPIQADAKTLGLPIFRAYLLPEFCGDGHASVEKIDLCDISSEEVFRSEISSALHSDFGSIASKIPGAGVVAGSGETVCLVIDPVDAKAYVHNDDGSREAMIDPHFLERIVDAADLMWRKLPLNLWK